MKKLQSYTKISFITLISFLTFAQNVFADFRPLPNDNSHTTPLPAPIPVEHSTPSEYIIIGIIVIIVVIITLIILSKIKRR